MTTANAIKKLSAYGEVKIGGHRNHYVHYKGYAVAFIDQGGEAICISSRSLACSDEHDMTDRNYWDNLTQAVRHSFGEAA